MNQKVRVVLLGGGVAVWLIPSWGETGTVAVTCSPTAPIGESLKSAKPNPHVGIVTLRCRGINQRREVVVEFKRTFMVHRRGSPEVADSFPGTDEPWTV